MEKDSLKAAGGRSAMIPSFLYSSSSSSLSKRLFDLDTLTRSTNLDHHDHGSSSSPPSISSLSSTKTATRSFVIPAPNEKVQMYSPEFYAACTAGGILSCGLTHTAVTPLDLVKCNMQVCSSLSLSLSLSFLASRSLSFPSFLESYYFLYLTLVC